MTKLYPKAKLHNKKIESYKNNKNQELNFSVTLTLIFLLVIEILSIDSS